MRVLPPVKWGNPVTPSPCQNQPKGSQREMKNKKKKNWKRELPLRILHRRNSLVDEPARKHGSLCTALGVHGEVEHTVVMFIFIED